MAVNPRSNAFSPRNTTALYLYFSFLIKFSFFPWTYKGTMPLGSEPCIFQIINSPCIQRTERKKRRKAKRILCRAVRRTAVSICTFAGMLAHILQHLTSTPLSHWHPIKPTSGHCGQSWAGSPSASHQPSKAPDVSLAGETGRRTTAALPDGNATQLFSHVSGHN